MYRGVANFGTFSAGFAGTSEVGKLVRQALIHLYDPSYLETHELARLMTPGDSPGLSRSRLLRDQLKAAIRALQPDDEVGSAARATRAYQLLTLRYLDGLTIGEVCNRLSIGRSEYHRTHKRAVDAVGLQMERALSSSVLPDSEKSPELSPLVDLPASSPLVGRSDELAHLHRRFQQVLSTAQGELVLITGDAGIGKTRLAHEFGARIERLNARFIAACYEREAFGPYDVWIELLAAGLAPYTMKQRADLAGPFLPQLARLFPGIGAPPQSPPMSRSRLAQQEERRTLFDGIVCVFRCLAEISPLVIMLDDLHRSPSLSLLAHLVKHLTGSRLLIVATLRRQEFTEQAHLTQTMAELTRRQVVTQIALEPLTQEETYRLLCSYFGPTAAAELQESILNCTQGNPFFVEELARALVQDGSIRFEGGYWSAVVPERIGLPATASAVVSERASRLGANVVDVLTWAAVLGRSFTYRLLMACTQKTDAELVKVLERAITARLLVDLSSAEGEIYSFSDDQTRDVLYESISSPRRRRMHVEVANEIERLDAGPSHAYVERLAYHFAEGGDAERGGRYAYEAGSKADEAFAWARAIRWYGTALGLWEELGGHLQERAAACEKLGEVSYKSGIEPAQGMVYLQKALSLYEQLGDQRHAAELHRWIAAEWSLSGNVESTNFDRVLEHLSTASRILGTDGPSEELAWIYVRQAQAHLWMFDVTQALAHVEHAIETAERSDCLAVVAEGLIIRAAANVYGGNLDGWREDLERAWEISSTHGFATQADLCRQQGAVLSGLLLKCPTEGMQWASRAPGFDTVWSVMRLRGNLLAMNADLGRFHDARYLHSELDAQLESSGQPRYGNLPSTLGRMLIRVGEWAEAEQILRDGLQWAREAHLTISAVAASRRLAELELGRGDYLAAESYLRWGIAQCNSGADLFRVCLTSLLGRVLVAQGRVGDASAELKNVTRLPGVDATRCGLAAEVAIAEGVVCAALNQGPEAEDAFERALSINRECGLVWDEAKTLFEWGCALRRGQADHTVQADRGYGLIRRALEQFEKMGALADIEACRVALAESGARPQRRRTDPIGDPVA